MEDFIEKYYGKNELLCPLGLLLRFNTMDITDILSYMLEREEYGTIYNMGLILDIKQSNVNPLLVEENIIALRTLLTEVATKYVETIKTKMNTEDENLIERIHKLEYVETDNSKQEAIIDKLKTNNVIKEYLPNMLENNNVNLYDFIKDNKFSTILPTDVTSLVKELSILKIVMSNVYSLLDNREQLNLRFDEKRNELIEVNREMFNKVNNINLEDDTCKDFITIYIAIKTLESNLHSTIKEIKNIKKFDLFDISELYINTLSRLDAKTLSNKDMEVFEKAEYVKSNEHTMYNKMIDGVMSDIKNISDITDKFNILLNKIDL